MASDSELKKWVSDRLMSILSFSSSIVVQLVIRLAKEASSPSDLAGKLVEQGNFPTSAEIGSFATELYSRVPHKSRGPSSYIKEERAAVAIARKQAGYKLIEDSDDNDANDNFPSASTNSKPSRGSSSKKQLRKRKEHYDDDKEDKPVSMLKSDRNVWRRSEPDEDDEDSELMEPKLSKAAKEEF